MNDFILFFPSMGPMSNVIRFGIFVSHGDFFYFYFLKMYPFKLKKLKYMGNGYPFCGLGVVGWMVFFY